MNQSNNYTIAATDGIALNTTIQSIESPKGIVLMVHGLGEYLGRYLHVARFFNENGFDFAIYDRRGHGKSGDARGHMPSLQQELRDIATQLKHLKSVYQDHKKMPPVFLYGHSQGGNIALNFMLRSGAYAEDAAILNIIRGVIITSPWLTLMDEPPAWLVRIGSFVQRFLPTIPNKIGLSQVSSDPAVNKKYAEDPEIVRLITFRAAHETIEASKWLLNYRNKVPFPLLLMHGTADSVTNPTSSEQFYNNIQQSCDFKLWDNLHHELHNEPQQLEVLQFISKWIARSW